MRKCGGVQLQRVGWCAVVAHREVSLLYLIVIIKKGSDKFLATQIITLYSAIQKNRCVCLRDTICYIRYILQDVL